MDIGNGFFKPDISCDFSSRFPFVVLSDTRKVYKGPQLRTSALFTAFLCVGGADMGRYPGFFGAVGLCHRFVYYPLQGQVAVKSLASAVDVRESRIACAV